MAALQRKLVELEKQVGGAPAGRGSGGGATTTGAAKAKAKWWCLLKGCEKSAKGAMNNANRTTCFCCGQQKGYCMSPPASLCRTTAQEGRAEGDKAGAAAEEKPPPVKPLAKAAAKPAEEKPTAQVLTLLPAVPAPPATSLYDKSRTAPPTTVTVRTVEECLIGAAPKDRALALANAREEVAHWQLSLDSAKKGAPGSSRVLLVPSLQKELDAATLSASKLEDSAPVTACTVTLLEKSLSDHRNHTSHRTAAWEKGAAKAKEAEDAVVAAVQQHIEDWQAYLAALKEDAKERLTAWNTHHEAVRDTTCKVEDKLKERLQTAVAAVPLTPSQVDANMAVASQAEVDRLAKEQLDCAMEAFKLLNATVVINPNDCKVFTQPPPKETVATLAAMFYWADSSSMGDAHLPFTLEDMQSTTEVAYSLVGDVIWGQFFGAAAVTVKTVVPMQGRSSSDS